MKTIGLVFAPLLASTMLVLSANGVLAQGSAAHQMMHGAHSDAHTAGQSGGNPTLPGQDAFGAIQEIVGILQADPSTDWAKVNIGALRDHLVDMNRLALDSAVRENSIDGGVEAIVTGKGRTLAAIQAMVLAHAPMIDGLNGWIAKAEKTTNGANLRVTAADPAEIARIRGLGFFGLMVSGSHHQPHHLGLARGENVHAK